MERQSTFEETTQRKVKHVEIRQLSRHSKGKQMTFESVRTEI